MSCVNYQHLSEDGVKVGIVKEEFTYPCLYCPKLFIDEWCIKKHLELAHIDKFIKVEVNLTPKNHQCSYCSTLFSSKWNLKRHMRSMHFENIIVREKYKSCVHCSEKFLTKLALRKHAKIHLPTFFDVKVICGYPCSYCDKRFTCNYNVKKHIELKHRIKVIAHRISRSCAHCSEEFLIKKELVNHVKCCPVTSCEDDLKETLPDGYSYNILESFKLSPENPDMTWFFGIFEIPINYEELLIWMKKYEKKNLVRFRVKDYHKREKIRTYVCRLRYIRGRPKKDINCKASLRYIIRSDKIEVALKYTHNHHLLSLNTLSNLRPIYTTKSEYYRLIKKGYSSSQIHYSFLKKMKKKHLDNYVATGDPNTPVSFYSASLDVDVSLPNIRISESDISKFSSELCQRNCHETNFVAENNRIPADQPEIVRLNDDVNREDFDKTDLDSENSLRDSETSKEIIKFLPPIYGEDFQETDSDYEYILGLDDSSEIIQLQGRVLEGNFQAAGLISENMPSDTIQYEPQLFQQSFLDVRFVSDKTFVSPEVVDNNSLSSDIYQRDCQETNCISDGRSVMPDLSNITKFSGIIYQDNSVDSNFVFQESNIPLAVDDINKMSVNMCQPNGEGTHSVSLEGYDPSEFFDFNKFSTVTYQDNSQNECLILENSLLNADISDVINQRNIRETDFISEKNCSDINTITGVTTRSNFQEVISVSEENCHSNTNKLSDCSDFNKISDVTNQQNSQEVIIVSEQDCSDSNKLSDFAHQRNSQEVNLVTGQIRSDINKISDVKNQQNSQEVNLVSKRNRLDINEISDVANQQNIGETNLVLERNCLDINKISDVANPRNCLEINFVSEPNCSDSNKLSEVINGQSFQEINFVSEKISVPSYPTDITHLDKKAGTIQTTTEFYGLNFNDENVISAKILTASDLSDNLNNTLSSDMNQENWQATNSFIENALTSSDVANCNKFAPNILREDSQDSSVISPNISYSVAFAQLPEQRNVDETTLITENVLDQEKNKIRNCFEQMLNRITTKNGLQYLPAFKKFSQNSATLETDLMLCSAFYTFGDHSQNCLIKKC